MRRFLSVGLIFSLFIAPAVYGAEKQKQEEELIREVLKPLESRGLKLETIKPFKDEKVPGFDGFIVEVKDENNARKIKKYIWI